MKPTKLIQLTIVFIFIFFMLYSLFATGYSLISAQTISQQVTLTYPIPQLDNCRDAKECYLYCEIPRNQEVCQEFAANLNLSQVLGVHTDSLAGKRSAFRQRVHQAATNLGINFPIAMEGALKLKELSYVHAEGYAAGEMKHGPIALIDPLMPVIAVMTESNVYEKVLGNLKEVKARDATVIAIATEGDELIHEVADEVLFVPKVSEMLSPIINVLPLQLLAYYVSVKRGYDVDQPRNLAKSVTVE